MPPVRSLPPVRTTSIAKPMKTERTHEENQERAYIAASRRSDRSLEARVESARRASEIHKKRTGRSLRVTEQDVINEEMYEEEDDELPMHYRRLTAHLHTSSSDFNRRLHAYLTNQVAMRDALSQAISSTYGPTGNDISTWDPSIHGFQGSWAPNQTQPQQQPQQQNFQQNSMMPYQYMPQSPSTNQQLPYQMASPYGQSNAMPHDGSTPTTNPSFVSFVPQGAQITSPSAVSSKSASDTSDNTPSLARSNSATSASSGPTKSSSLPSASMSANNNVPEFNTSTTTPDFQSQNAMPWSHLGFNQNIGPFTNQLAPNTQMLLNGPQFDPNGYNGSLKHPHYPQTKQQEQPFYSYGLDSFEKQNSSLPSFDGMNQTLAPGALDNKQDQLGIVKSPRADSLVSPFDTTFNDSYDSAFDSHGTFNRHFAMDSLPPSGQNTPGASEWSSFLNDSSWADEIN